VSGVSIVGVVANGVRLTEGLGHLLALDPAEAAGRNERIRRLTEERRSRRAALEAAEAHAVDERERLAQLFIRARVDAAGAAAALAAAGLPPEPGLEPPGPGGDVQRWCREVPEIVRAAHARAGAAIAEHAVRRLVATLAGTSFGPPVTAADLLGADRPDPTSGPTPDPESDSAAVLARMLSTLDARASAADRELVEAAAAEAAARRADRAAYLVQLRLRIQEANDRVSRRHDDAVVAAQLLDAIEPYRPEHGLDPDDLRTARSALAEVVAGRRELDDALLDQVARLRERVEARASTEAVTDALADVLGELGYLVGPDFSVGEAVAGGLEVSHPGQPDHLVRIRVDAEEQRLVAMVYRAGAGAQSPDDTAADAAAEAAWCQDLDRALAQLANSGFELRPLVLTEPGSRPTPAIGAAAGQAAAASEAAASEATKAAEASERRTTGPRHRTHQRPE